MTLPAYVSSSTGNHQSSLSDEITLTIPTVNSGDFLVLVLGTTSNNGEGYTLSGDVPDWQLDAQYKDVSGGAPQVFIYSLRADGSESGLTVVCTRPSGTVPHAGIIHRFTGVKTVGYFESLDMKLSTGAVVEDVDITSTGLDRLAVNIIVDLAAGSAYDAFTGQTGGTWVNRSWFGALSPSLGMETADLPAIGTIGGGSVTLGAAHTTRVVGFALTPKDAGIGTGKISSDGLQELNAQECGTPWLVLLTLDHPSFSGDKIRVTSDGVETISRSEIFTPFNFTVKLPDSAEGKIAQASISIDNTSLEIISKLRGLSDPLSLTIEIVRSENLDYVERSWEGLSWINSTYNIGSIEGTLTVEDLATEEFGMTFDRRYRGLFA